MYNASDRKDIRKAEKAAAIAESNRIAFLRAALTTIEGRQFFHDFLTRCHLFTSAPIFEPNRDYFAAGERNIGLQIFADITVHCPDSYLVMMREAAAQETPDVRRSPDPDRTGSSSELAGSADSGWDTFDESVDGSTDA
jgi:hypothetical protein